MNRIAAVAFLLALGTGCAPAADPPGGVARPKTILLIRHAEKPADPGDSGLSPAGRDRAAALPGLFKKSPARPDPFPTPDFVFATKASAKSNRPAETVAPLAKALGLEVEAKFHNDEFEKLAAKLLTTPKYAGKTVLVCWHHGKLPELARALTAAGVPDTFGDAVFDRVWVVTFDDAGKGRPLANRPQALRPGDSE